MISAQVVDGATPTDRDRVIDFVRAVSIVVVIAGHWLMATVTVRDGTLTGSNALVTLPSLHALTWLLQVMPLFFIAGGFANRTVWRTAHSYAEYVDRRLRRLLPPTIVFVLAIPLLLACLDTAGLRADVRDEVAHVLGQPLWFLGVFVTVTVLAPPLSLAHERWPKRTMAALLLAPVAIDAARMLWTAEIGYLNMGLAWLFIQQLGFWYADRRFETSRPVLWAMLIGALMLLVVLTSHGPYPVSMVGLPGQMSNLAPPSVCLLVLAIAQFSGLLLVRGKVAGWLNRPALWLFVVSAGSMAMSLYLWHLAVLAAGFAATWAVGLPVLEPGTGAWWLTRPVWLAILGAGLVPLAMSLSRLERPRERGPVAGGAIAALVAGGLIAAGLFSIVLGGLVPTATTGLSIALMLAGFGINQSARSAPLTRV